MTDQQIEARLIEALDTVTPDLDHDARKRMVGEFLATMGKILEATHNAPLGMFAARMAALCAAAQSADVERLTPDEMIMVATLVEAAQALRQTALREQNAERPA